MHMRPSDRGAAGWGALARGGLVGGLAGGIVMAMFLPIFQLGAVAGGLQ